MHMYMHMLVLRFQGFFLSHHNCGAKEYFMNAFKHPSVEALKFTKVFHVRSMFARLCFPINCLL
jgi:hypothetical protein